MVIDITKRPGKDFFIRPGLRIHLEGNIRAECASVSPFPVIYHIIIIMWFLFARKNKPHPFELPNMLHTAFHGIDARGGYIGMSQQVRQF